MFVIKIILDIALFAMKIIIYRHVSKVGNSFQDNYKFSMYTRKYDN